MITRRKALFTGAAALAGGGAILDRAAAADVSKPDQPNPSLPREFTAGATGEAFVNQTPLAPGEAGKHYNPVVTPNGWTLPFRVVDGVKVFHLIAEEFDHEFAPGLTAKCWGYNGSTPGPTIEAVEGDRIRVYITNRLPEPTSIHWHGVLLPNGMDGVAGLSHPAIRPGQTFKYEFTLRQHGTHMYHPHF